MSEPKPFHLRGNFAPVEREVTATDLPVTGALPPELTGLYARQAPNPKTGHSDHWFLGDGMVHGVRLEAGRAAWYRNRYVKTPYLDDPGVKRISETGVVDRTVSKANTSVLRHAGRILALEEGSFPYVLDDELETLGWTDFDGRLQSAFTAHPKICPVTGEMIGFGYGQLPPYLTYLRLSPEGSLVQCEEISVGGPTMMHDCAASERHTLFLDLPVVFSIQDALKGEMPFSWSEDYGARIGVMPRAGGDADVRWFEVEPCFVFHTVNAWEEGDTVVLDACRYASMWRRDGDRAGERDLRLHRFSFDLASGAVKEETLDDRPMEFPRVADGVVGQPNRYAFSVMLDPQAGAGEATTLGILKIDFRTGRSDLHEFGESRNASEAVFVPAPGAAPDSDEGWLMSYVHDEATNETELVVLDASDMAAAPVARVGLPQRVPYGFHGSWIPDAP